MVRSKRNYPLNTRDRTANPSPSSILSRSVPRVVFLPPLSGVGVLDVETPPKVRFLTIPLGETQDPSKLSPQGRVLLLSPMTFSTAVLRRSLETHLFPPFPQHPVPLPYSFPSLHTHRPHTTLHRHPCQSVTPTGDLLHSTFAPSPTRPSGPPPLHPPVSSLDREPGLLPSLGSGPTPLRRPSLGKIPRRTTGTTPVPMNSV